jgi:hypothetical protein
MMLKYVYNIKHNLNVNTFFRDPNRDPMAVGRSDLNPFSRGGGMLFSPFPRRFRDPGAGIPGGLPR